MTRRPTAPGPPLPVCARGGARAGGGPPRGRGTNPATTECVTADTSGGGGGEQSATDTSLVGRNDPAQGGGDLGAGGQAGANDQEQSNSAAGGFGSPQNTNPANGQGTGGNGDTGSGGSSRGSC